MDKVTGWWFAPEDNKLANGDGREIKVGVTHRVEGEIIPCHYGLHLSKRAIDALMYAPGPVIYRVEGSGAVIPHGDPVDKYACSRRTYLSGGIDCTELLRKFSRLCALDVIHLWDAPNVVVQYLKTGDESLRAASRAAAMAAAWSVARAASRAASRAAAWSASRAAAWSAARAASRAAEAAWAEAVDEMLTKFNRRLTTMLINAIKEARNG